MIHVGQVIQVGTSRTSCHSGKQDKPNHPNGGAIMQGFMFQPITHEL